MDQTEHTLWVGGGGGYLYSLRRGLPSHPTFLLREVWEFYLQSTSLCEDYFPTSKGIQKYFTKTSEDFRKLPDVLMNFKVKHLAIRYSCCRKT